LGADFGNARTAKNRAVLLNNWEAEEDLMLLSTASRILSTNKDLGVEYFCR